MFVFISLFVSLAVSFPFYTLIISHQWRRVALSNNEGRRRMNACACLLSLSLSLSLSPSLCRHSLTSCILSLSFHHFSNSFYPFFSLHLVYTHLISIWLLCLFSSDVSPMSVCRSCRSSRKERGRESQRLQEYRKLREQKISYWKTSTDRMLGICTSASYSVCDIETKDHKTVIYFFVVPLSHCCLYSRAMDSVDL